MIENIGRSFHVLGGKGALQRWLGSLSVAKPYSAEAYRREEEARAIEETQWWLQCLATSWMALLDETEKSFLANPFVGASTNLSLPLSEPSKNPREVLGTILQACDWEQLFERTRHYDASVGAVQSWVRSVDGLLQYESSLPFIDLCRLAADQTKLPMNRVRHSDVHICTPMQAFGVSSNLTLFVGIDAESWSMKPERVPWIDDAVRVELGLNDCLLYTSPSPRDKRQSRMPSSA